jgi:hypothetical protein
MRGNSVLDPIEKNTINQHLEFSLNNQKNPLKNRKLVHCYRLLDPIMTILT